MMPRRKKVSTRNESEVVDVNDTEFAVRCRTLGVNIRLERRKRGFSIQDVATYLGLSTSYVGLLERGVRSPSLKNFFNLCDLFSATPDELMLVRDTPNKLKVAERGYKTAERNHFEAIQSLLKNLDEKELEFVSTVLKGLQVMKNS